MTKPTLNKIRDRLADTVWENLVGAVRADEEKVIKELIKRSWDQCDELHRDAAKKIISAIEIVTDEKWYFSEANDWVEAKDTLLEALEEYRKSVDEPINKTSKEG